MPVAEILSVGLRCGQMGLERNDGLLSCMMQQLLSSVVSSGNSRHHKTTTHDPLSSSSSPAVPSAMGPYAWAAARSSSPAPERATSFEERVRVDGLEKEKERLEEENRRLREDAAKAEGEATHG